MDTLLGDSESSIGLFGYWFFIRALLSFVLQYPGYLPTIFMNIRLEILLLATFE